MTYIHKHGPESGSVNLKDYELGISDAAYIYTFLGGAKTALKVKQADNADNIGGSPAGDFFKLTGQDQNVNDTNVSFAGNVTVTTKVTCPTFEGTATHAKYADIAENYESDCKYPAGTVLFFGKTSEVSINGEIFAGIVSDKPGFMLNDQPDFETYVPIVLKGRSPVITSEPLEKGDIAIVDRENPGKAKKGEKSDIKSPDFIGVVLQTFTNGYAEVKV